MSANPAAATPGAPPNGRSAPSAGLPRRAQDAAAILVLAVTASEIARATFGLSAGVGAVGFVSVWLSQAVRRVIDWRRGRAAATVLRLSDPAHVLLLAFGLLPWTLLPALRTLHPDWSVWGALTVPVSLKVIGAVAGVVGGVVAIPGRCADTPLSHGIVGAFASPGSAPAQLFVLSMLLASGSALVALLSLYWLSAYAGVWCADRWNDHTKVGSNSDPSFGLEPG
jgi:hypothetical protein